MVRRTSEHIFLLYFILICFSLLLLGGGKVGILTFLRYPLEIILVPPRKFLYSLKIQVGQNSQIFFDKTLRQKISKNDELEREVAVLQAKIQLLGEENAVLRKQLEAPLPAAWNFIPAQVLGRERFLLIDKGAKDGISKNMVVISENILVGKIWDVKPKTAQIIILPDPELKVPVTTNNNVKGLLMGVFGNKIVLSRVLQRDPLKPLDIVMTSGEENFPPNLVIGKIDNVSAKQGEVYKEGTVTPLIDYDKLRYVSVVASY